MTPPIFELKNICKSFDKKLLFQSFNLSLLAGESLGIYGPSGCGKSSLLKMMMQLMPYEDGSIYFKGELINAKGFDKKLFYQQVQLVMQNFAEAFNPKMTIYQNIAEPIIIKGEFSDANIQELIADVGLSRDKLFKYPHELSGGELQRAVIARAISLRPSCLLLDEPTSALDLSIQSQVINLLITLQKEHNLAYLLVSHDINLLNYFCDRVITL